MYSITANGSVTIKSSSDSGTAGPGLLFCTTMIFLLVIVLPRWGITVGQHKKTGLAVWLSLLLLLMTLPLAVILYINAMCKGTKPLNCFGQVFKLKLSISSLIVSRGLFFHFSKGLDIQGVKLIKVHFAKRLHEFSWWHLPSGKAAYEEKEIYLVVFE